MPVNKKTYIGDGVYASHDGYQILLETDVNHIFLEPEVCVALAVWAQDLYEKHGKSSSLQLQRTET